MVAESDERFNKHRSYRLLEHGSNLYLRGITSVNRYFEYGVDFAFVVTILMLHLEMMRDKGNGYEISSAALSESKLELIISEKKSIDAGEFGKVSTAMVVSINDLGDCSLHYTKVIKVGIGTSRGVFLFPKAESTHRFEYIIPHSTGPDRTMVKLKEVMSQLSNTENFIHELHDIKGIKTPDELRQRILNKLSNRNSAFKEIEVLADIFK